MSEQGAVSREESHGDGRNDGEASPTRTPLNSGQEAAPSQSLRDTIREALEECWDHEEISVEYESVVLDYDRMADRIEQVVSAWQKVAFKSWQDAAQHEIDSARHQSDTMERLAFQAGEERREAREQVTELEQRNQRLQQTLALYENAGKVVMDSEHAEELERAEVALAELEAEVRLLGEAHPLDPDALPPILHAGTWADGREYVYVEDPERHWGSGMPATRLPRIAALLQESGQADGEEGS